MFLQELQQLEILDLSNICLKKILIQLFSPFCVIQIKNI